MAFNGSGVFNRIHSWVADLASLVPVTASRMDAEMNGIADGLSACITRNGESTTTARITFASGTSAAAGTTASVSYAQTNDANTGMYFPATDQWGLVAGGTATLTSTATGLSAAVTLSPASSDGAALGTSSLMWSDGFFASGAVINFNNGDVTLTHAANALTLEGGNFGIGLAPLYTLTVKTAADKVLSVRDNSGLEVVAHNDANNAAVALKFFALSYNFANSAACTFTGAVTCSTTLAVTGDFAVNTNKVTIAAASGNTAIAGTLAVTGAQTNTGALSANNSAGITGRNTVKAFGSIVDGVKSAGFNFTGVTDNGSSHTITFDSAMANDDYAIILTLDRANAANTDIILGYHTVAAGSFRVEGHRPAVSGNVDPDSYSFMVLSNE